MSLKLGIAASAHTVLANNYAVRFDASNERYTTNFGLATGSWTICGWVKLAVDRNDYTNFFSVEDPTTDGYIYCWTSSNGTQAKRESVANGVNFVNMTVGTWYFFALTYAPTTSDSNFWMAAGSGSTTEVPGYNSVNDEEPASSSRITIGSNRFNTWLNGSIAAIKIWTTVLTKTEIDAEISTYAPVKTANLWAYYTFREGPSTTDDSGNGHTLTLTGAVGTDTSGPPIT